MKIVIIAIAIILYVILVCLLFHINNEMRNSHIKLNMSELTEDSLTKMRKELNEKILKLGNNLFYMLIASLTTILIAIVCFL